ncbi:MAG TPA: hypothetical protein VG890_08535, partial [Puia sp.]|nr:hypothetical protein [Puia sp.]
MNHIRLYNIFRRKLHLPDDTAVDAVQAIQDITDSSLTSKMNMPATKEDIYSVRTSVRTDIQDAKDSLYRAIYLSG